VLYWRPICRTIFSRSSQDAAGEGAGSALGKTGGEGSGDSLIGALEEGTELGNGEGGMMLGNEDVDEDGGADGSAVEDGGLEGADVGIEVAETD